MEKLKTFKPGDPVIAAGNVYGTFDGGDESTLTAFVRIGRTRNSYRIKAVEHKSK